MSTEKTEKLALHRWVAEDLFLRTEFNENFTAIDQQFASVDDRLDTHAAQHGTGGGDPITPADIGAATAADLTSHTGNKSNPHGVTVAQIGAAAASHNHSAANITSGTLSAARGGTGLTASPSMLVNLASTSAANVLQASPRPGVTGTLPVARGGTGVTTIDALRAALSVSGGSMGTYTGTDVARTIAVGEGTMCMIWCARPSPSTRIECAFVHSEGVVMIYADDGSTGNIYSASRVIKFNDGVLSFAATSKVTSGYTYMNDSDDTYHYRVLF